MFVARVAPERRFVTACHNSKRYQQREVTMQNQPVYIPKWKGSKAQKKRNAQVIAHIKATEKELKNGK